MKNLNKKLIVLLMVLLVFLSFAKVAKAETKISTNISRYIYTLDNEKSNNNYLKKLSISKVELSPNFDKNTLEYSATVDYNFKNVTVKAKRADRKATVTGAGTIPIQVGENKIEIVVKAEDGSKRTYTITVERAPSVIPDDTEEEETDEYGIPIYRIKDQKIVNYTVDCEDWKYFNTFWKIIRLLGPFIYLIFASFDLIKMIMSGGEEEIKKAKKIIPKRLLIFALFILIPFLVSYLIIFAGKNNNAGNLQIFRCIVDIINVSKGGS